MARLNTRKALGLLPVLALAVTTAGCAQEIDTGGATKAGDQIKYVKPDTLTTCTHLPYAPFQFKEGDKTVGFDVELVDEVAKDLGVKQEIFDTPFEGIESGQAFNTAQCDVAAAAMTITDTRKTVMDFSDPYFDAKQVLLVKSGAGLDSLDKLRGKTLGVQLGTTGEEYAEKNKEQFGYQIRQYEDLGLLQNAVKTGGVEAGINDNGVNLDFVRKNPDTQVTQNFDTGEVYGIGVRKGNEALRAKVNESLAKVKSSGKYDELYQKWFGTTPPAQS